MVFADKPHPTNWRICKFTFLNYNVEISSTPVIWCLPSPNLPPPPPYLKKMHSLSLKNDENGDTFQEFVPRKRIGI